MVLVALLLLATAQAPSTPLVGSVVGDDGTPVARARLVLTGAEPGGESSVVAQGTSDDDGSFRIDRPAALKPINQSLCPTLWIAAPGRLVSVVKFVKRVPSADEPVRVVMKPAARTEVRVESPEGKPVAGARVNVQRILSEPSSVPEPVFKLTEGTTGSDGLAVIDGFAAGEVGAVDVIAEGFGIQPRWINPYESGTKRVRLITPAALAGRLVPEQSGLRP